MSPLTWVLYLRCAADSGFWGLVWGRPWGCCVALGVAGVWLLVGWRCGVWGVPIPWGRGAWAANEGVVGVTVANLE